MRHALGQWWRRRLPGRDAIRRRAASAYLGDHLALARVLGRYKMYVDTRDRSVSAHLMLDGQWELWVTRALRRCLRPGMVVADVGANLGYFSIFMADRVGDGGHVHAFEPNRDMAGLLRRSAQVNGLADRITLHETALGEEDGKPMELVQREGEPGGAAIWPPSDPPLGRPLRLRRLDAIPGMERIELIKIDAEGAEPAIWAGMAGLLAGPALRTVFVEFTAGHYADPASFLAALTAAGFGLSRVDQRRGVVATTPAEVLARPAAQDLMLVLTRPSRDRPDAGRQG